MTTNSFLIGGVPAGANSGVGSPDFIMLGGVPLAIDGTEAHSQAKVQGSFTFTALAVRIITNTGGTNETNTFRKNTADGNQVATVTAGAAGWFSDTTHSDSLVAGDLYDVKRNSGGFNTQTLSYVYGDSQASAPAAIYASGSTGHINISTSAQYQAPFGSIGTDATEANAAQLIRAAGTLTELLAFFLTSSTGTTTIQARKNAGNGNQVLSVGSSTTGLVQDTTHSDAVLTGDTFDSSLVGTNASGSIGFITYNFAGTLSAHDFGASVGGGAVGPTSNTTSYGSLAGLVGFTTTEANVQLVASYGTTLSRYRCNVRANTSTTSTGTSRKNGADGNQTFSVTSGGTGGFEDTTHSDTLVSTDTFGAKFATSPVTTLQINGVSMVSDDGSQTATTNVNLTAAAATGAVASFGNEIDVAPATAAATGAAAAVSVSFPGGVQLSAAATSGAVGAFSPQYDGHASPTAVSAHGVAGTAQAGVAPMAAGATALPVAEGVHPQTDPFVIFPVLGLMRNTAVPAIAPMSDDPVALVMPLPPSGPAPMSVAQHLIGVSAAGRAATVTPFFNVSVALTAVSSAAAAAAVVAA